MAIFDSKLLVYQRVNRIMLALSEFTGEKTSPVLYHKLSELKYIDSGRFRRMTCHFWIGSIEKCSKILYRNLVYTDKTRSRKL